MPASIKNDSVTIGRILKPFGVKGEVRVESLSDIPDRFENLPIVRLVTPNGESVTTSVTQARLSGKSYLLTFKAFSSPEEALKFRGALIQTSPDQARPSKANEYYHYELIDLSVQDECHRILGQVDEILDLPQHPVFVVRAQDGKEYLIPATRQTIRRIDLEGRQITVAPMEQWDISYAM